MFFKRKTLLSCSILSLFLASCVTRTEIMLKKDGSAHITSDRSIYPKDFFKSDQVTDLAWIDDSIRVTFNIKTIDSLGNYLYDDFEKNYFQFRYSNDTLTFSDGNTPTFRWRHYRCWTSYIRITSEREIKSVETENSFVKHKKDAVIIEKAGRKFHKEKKDTKVVVFFGE